MYIMKYLKPYKWQAISGFIFKLRSVSRIMYTNGCSSYY